MVATTLFPPRPAETKTLRASAFVLRCAGAATIAYELASALALPEAPWAAMSALLVSQERPRETRASLTGRILGTLLGIAVAIVVNAVASHFTASAAPRMAAAVAICPFVCREFPKLRVTMWTCPIIFQTARPAASILFVALQRGGEVILGALVGWALHWVAEILVRRPIDATARHPFQQRP